MDNKTGFPSRPESYGVFTPAIIKQMQDAPNAGEAKRIGENYLKRITRNSGKRRI